MNRYNASSLTATQCLFTSALPVLLYIRTVGGVWLLPIVMVGTFIVLSTFGGTFYRIRIISLTVLLLCAAFFSLQNAFRISSFSCGIKKEHVCEIEGVVIYDSSFSGQGNSIIKLYTYGCKSVYGIKCTSRGVVTVVAKPNVTTMAFSRVKIKGSFINDLFVSEDLIVLNFIRANEIRTRFTNLLIKNLEYTGDPSRLCCSLIFGTSYENGTPLRDKARLCGCLHVLALSGMHLGVIVKICRIFGKNKLSEILSVLLACFFIFIAGPRPSLIRAFLSFFAVKIFRRSDSGTVLIYVLIAQSVLFPATVCDLGFVYCYCSICALTVLSPVLKSVFVQFMPKIISSFVSDQLSVVIVNAAVQLLIEGQWNPAVIVAGFPASVIVEAIMFCGIFIIVLGPLPTLKKINLFLYSCLEDVFDKCCNLFPSASWGLYFVIILFVFTTAVILVIQKNIIRKANIKKQWLNDSGNNQYVP